MTATAKTESVETLELGAGLDALGKGPISTAPFVSVGFFEQEKTIWKDAWLMLGRECDLDQDNNYITFDLKVIGVSVMVVRDREGGLRAFHNVCPHRGSRLLCEKQGKSSVIVCPFHAWAFKLNGELQGVPEKQLFENLEPKENYNLKPVSVDTWGGFIFVNLDTEPKYGLGAYLSGLPKNLAGYLENPAWQWYTGYQRSFKANWKDLMNIQHEGYHASHVHRKTLGARFGPEQVRVTAFPGSPGVSSLLSVLAPVGPGGQQQTEITVRQLSGLYGSTANWVGLNTSGASEEFPGAVNQGRSENWVFDCYTFFPNLILFVGTNVLSVMRVWPLTAHEADWEWDWFFKDEFTNFGHLFNREHGRLDTRNALGEDWPVCEWAHQGMQAGVINKIIIGSDMEASVRAHYEKLLSHMGLNEEDLDGYAT